MMKVLYRVTQSCTAALLVPAVIAAPAAAAVQPAEPATTVSAPALLQPVAFGDLPASGHRRRPAHAEKAKPYVPLAKDPAAIPDEAHKAYLKRYGF